MFRSTRSREGLAATRRLCAPVAAVLAAVALAPAAGAQTIVPNPHLDTQLAPWTAFVSAAPDPAGSGTAPAWQATPDVDGSATSGSALIHANTSAPALNAASGMRQCFNFAGGPAPVSFLNYGMAFRLPATTAIDGSVNATVEMRLFSGAGCSGFIAGGTQGQDLASPAVVAGTWYRLADNSFVPPGAPVTAASVEVRGYLRQTGVTPTQADYAIDLDHFVVVLNSTTPVELLHFDIR
jgi:hypothetical protein